MRTSRVLLLVAILAALPWGCSGCPGLPWPEDPAQEEQRRPSHVVEAQIEEPTPEPEPVTPEPEPEPAPQAVTIQLRLGDCVPVHFGDGRPVTLIWNVPVERGTVHVGVRPPRKPFRCTTGGWPLEAVEQVTLRFGEAYGFRWEGKAQTLDCSLLATEPIEALAVFVPDGWAAEREPPRATFPSDAILNEIAAEMNLQSPAAFSERRQSAWGIPRRPLLVKAAPPCASLEQLSGARRCSAALLEAIFHSLSRHMIENQAVLRSLAIYLDDDALAQAVDALAADDAETLARVQPDARTVATARAMTDRLYATTGGEVAAALPVEPEAAVDVLEPAADPGIQSAPQTAALEPPPLERLQPLARELHRSRAGRELLDYLTGAHRREELTATSLLAVELAADVRRASAQLADPGDHRLVAAAQALDDIPHRAATPTAAVMVLLDEWTERATGPEPYPSVLARLRKDKLPHKREIEGWLAQQFPIYYPRAQRILAAVAPPPAAR